MSTATPGAPKARLRSLDLVRGAVMVLMAVDHVRVYSGVPAGARTAGIFFTRWITHFCAPVFVFFAGTAAYLHGRKLGSPAKLAAYLVSRGLMLVVLELTLIRAGWTFGFDYSQFLLAGVIWMIGWCMVLLAALVWLPTWAIGTFGLAVMAFQNLAAVIGGNLPDSLRWAWEFLYPVGVDVRLGANGPSVAVLYTIVPWIGVMAAGYAFGSIMTREPEARHRWCLRAGLAATALFVAGAALQVGLSPAGDDAPPVWFRFLNQVKYPASQLFLLMTLGPAIALLPAAERARGRIADALVVFGRVPFFYYLLHIPLIHLTSLIVWFLRDGGFDLVDPRFATAPYVSVPPETRWSLGLLYVVVAVNVALLYLACRWYAGVKARSRSRWLQYL
jgi:uncharacterized membrane protein